MLDNPNEPVSDLSYFDCIESVMENSKVGLLNQTAQEPFTHTELDILSIPPFLHLFLFCWTAPLSDTGPGRVHGRYFSELQDWRCACFWRLRRIGLKSSVWPHWSCRTGTGCLTAKELTSGSYCLYVTDDGRCFCFFLFLHRPPTWWACLIPTVKQGTRGWWIPSSLPKPTRPFRWPVRIL